MTRQASYGSDFSQWVRSRSEIDSGIGYSVQNLDFVVHNYRENWLLLIEEKTRGGMKNRSAERAQDDTHGIIHQMLKAANETKVMTMRGVRPAYYRGYYKVVFSGLGPQDSEWVEVNGERKSVDDLLRLLRTGSTGPAYDYDKSEGDIPAYEP